ncbi:MAG: intradiol ring-cleavage dioxygenase [Acidobacteria bacterium]|nr:intradiol ring-cleavage dioxygenase [Acidobacteriota bacterium]
MNRPTENRRDFLRRTMLAAFALPFLTDCRVFAQKSTREILEAIRKNAGDPENCNWCGAAREAPDEISWKTALADEKDAGEPLVIAGTVYEKDGRTPAPNILIYAYHTNAEGFYGRGKGEHPHGKHHGWMLTGKDGRYEFRTIKPAPYPARDTPAHIHFTLTGLRFREYWIDDVWFEGDELITPEIKKKQLSGRGGFNPIVRLERGADGVRRGLRDIRLDY